MECGVPLSGTDTGALSACDDQCALEVLSCQNISAWDLYDTTSCNSEHAFFASTICEFTDISGFPIEVRALLVNEERLWGEDPNATLSDPMLTKAIFEPSEETTVLNMWGMVADDTMQYIVIPKSIWTRDLCPLYTITPGLSGKPCRPQAGDVLTTLFNNRNYEITDVGEENAIFMGKKFAWELIVKPYRFSEQSDEHRVVTTGSYDDPFETIVEGPTGQMVPQNNYVREQYGDNTFVEEQSDDIDDYRDINTLLDPDKGAFGY